MCIIDVVDHELLFKNQQQNLPVDTMESAQPNVSIYIIITTCRMSLMMYSGNSYSI